MALEGKQLGSIVTVLALGLGSCAPDGPPNPYANAEIIETLGEALGGDKAIGQPGDFLLETERFRAVILSGRNSMGPGLHGGSLVDADLVWRDAARDQAKGRDAWNELFPTVSMNVPGASEPADVFIAQEGSETEAAIVRVKGEATPFLSLLDLLWTIVKMPQAWIITDYIAEPGVP